MIVVTGATGQLGHAIVEQLVNRGSASAIGVSVRALEKAAAWAAKGVRVRRGDFEDAESLKHAFEGASQVLMVSSNARAFGGDPIAQHRKAIDAAKAVGVKRIVYTSQIAASPTSAFNPALDHAATEAMLRDSGLPFTSLRNGFYAASAIAMMMGAVKAGELVTPESGKFSWVGHEDLAQGAAAVLLDESRFDGPTPPLTGAAGLDFGDLARLAGEVTGKPLKHTVLTDEAYVAKSVERGMPEGRARFALGMFLASRRGEFAAVDQTLEKLIGHPCATFKTLLAASLAA